MIFPTPHQETEQLHSNQRQSNSHCRISFFLKANILLQLSWYPGLTEQNPQDFQNTVYSYSRMQQLLLVMIFIMLWVNWHFQGMSSGSPAFSGLANSSLNSLDLLLNLSAAGLDSWPQSTVSGLLLLSGSLVFVFKSQKLSAYQLVYATDKWLDTHNIWAVIKKSDSSQ